MDTRILEKIGFTDGEIKVYIALLGLGNTSTGSIIERSGVSRSKVYEILGRLQKKGMATQTYAGGVRHFVATSPSRILDYLSSKESQINAQKAEFERELPRLISLQVSSSEAQETRIYTGYEGIAALYEEMASNLSSGDEYLSFISSDDELGDERMARCLGKFHKVRALKKVKARILSCVSARAEYQKTNFLKTGLIESRRCGAILPSGIAIFSDTTVTFDWGEHPRAFSIVCKRNAARNRDFFLSVWNKAKAKQK